MTAGRSGGGTQSSAGRSAGGHAGSSGGSDANGAGEGGSRDGSGGSGATASGGGPQGSLLNCDEPGIDAAGFRNVYDVGPGKDYETPSDVPWEALEPSTLVRIHARTEPYRDKWVLNSAGTASEPIVVLGVPANGVLPEISGEDAVTRGALDYWGEARGVVKVGGANAGSGAAYIAIACLDIHTGRPGTSFTDASGSDSEYAENAACVYLEEGHHITLAQNQIHDCGNGIFSSNATSDLLITGNHVFDNGNAGSIYEHNSYTESTNITFEFNHFGPLGSDCGGNNLKDRSAGTVVRYNWIEGGNRQLDLVESDYDQIIDNPAYRRTFVYGNVLVEPNGAGNSQIVHYGGDDGDETKYRKGTLYFAYNTVVSTRSDHTTLFRLSSEDEHVDARNNVFWVSAAGSSLAISDEMGKVDLTANWLPSGWVETHGSLSGTVVAEGNLEGAQPGFSDASNQDFSLCSCSACRGSAVTLPADLADVVPHFEYAKDQSGAPRTSCADLGAYQAD